MRWLLHKAIFSKNNTYEDAVDIITKLGDTAVNAEEHINTYNSTTSGYPGNTTGLVSLACARDLGFYNPQLFQTSYYMQFCPELFLNSDCIYLPFWKLKSFVYGQEHSTYFMKPNSGFKYFTGFCTDIDSIDRDILSISIPHHEMVMLTNRKSLGPTEYRFYIVGGKIVTQSSYSWSSMVNNCDYVTKERMEFVQKAIERIKMDNYTLDVADVFNPITQEWEIKIVELNCLYTSGVYACNLEKLILAIKDDEERVD